MSIYRGSSKKEFYLASLLYDAIEDQDIRSVKTLLAKGADPNLVLPKKKISPLHLIIGNDSEEFTWNAMLLMLQSGGNPNVPSDDGLTPMHIAAAWGRIEILRLLLNCGGNPEVLDSNRMTPLNYAADEQFPELVKLLKLYLPDGMAIFNRVAEDDERYSLQLDKILVNNGTTVGEYEIINEYKADSVYYKHLQRLQELPQPSTEEYINNWFNKHQTDRTPPQTSSPAGASNSDDSSKESDAPHRRLDAKHITFRKVYRKKSKTPPKAKTPIPIAPKAPSCPNYSKESGITLLDDSVQLGTTASSEYLTASPLERNVFDLTECSLMTADVTNGSAKSEGISSSDLSFVSVSEVYKYVDREEGIVLYERRFLKTPISDCSVSVKSFNLSSLPETLDYEDIDSETIRKELTLLGYNPGPITTTTKRIYLKKLKQLKRHPVVPSSGAVVARVYSSELEKTLKNPQWLHDVQTYKALDEAVLRQFTTPDPSKRWREGVSKSSFTYLLLDPRITNNLPHRAEALPPKELWEVFLSAVFYVGKGKRSRPYSHLYKAVTLWNSGQRTSDDKKLNRILNIWGDNCGVVCLHIFQNTIPVEAFTREAAIINALRLDNLCNAIGGQFYGVAATWTQREKCMLGAFLLYKAMMIFLNEGERQLCPSDID